MRQGTRDATPSRGGGAEGDEFRAGPAVEVGDVYAREDGVAVCAEGCGADLVWGGQSVGESLIDILLV